PDCETEHPTQGIDAICAMVLVKMDDRFGIAARRQQMAGSQESLAELEIIVDLAIEDDPVLSCLVTDRLITGLQDDDLESPHSKSGWSIHHKAIAVWAAMLDDVAHAGQDLT